MNTRSDIEIKITALEILVRELINALDKNTLANIFSNLENGFKITESDDSLISEDKIRLRGAIYRMLTLHP
ncbi:hypothetical protein LB105_000875 [Salmonella enterica]|uniref:Uncharacterized protein n=3 Tax=Salmonella enterica TaxID=28901 RepID=A0A5X8XX90_SALNE|nr:hypothetical protein [Salmonella enterica]EBV0463056.1 hypothetical protein [Salmonella enterica subsp. enterica serovar Newport]EBW8393465.1 hypothetical protein [Salmonella enterica subsp. enterica serovar Florida]EBW9463637.1 hypothetical protein [Salmonella enterica subsp. enterica serovar Panama]ECC9075867.1 hypothetical protein [Salmonella enterica subsp. enterica]ASD87125.1 hypothetical protein LFZ16_13190 [Salmonella enterica subsp. enterica serovar India str. SA20085604]